MTNTDERVAELVKAIGTMAGFFCLSTFVFALFMKNAGSGNAGCFAVWGFGSLIAGVPALLFVKGTKRLRLIVGIAYVLTAVALLLFLLGLIGRLMGVIEGL